MENNHNGTILQQNRILTIHLLLHEIIDIQVLIMAQACNNPPPPRFLLYPTQVDLTPLNVSDNTWLKIYRAGIRCSFL